MSNILLGKLKTELKTVTVMTKVYCSKHHSKPQGGVCDICQPLLEYAETRLDRCPYGEDKPACNKCPIHCYKPEPKAQMRAIMRFSGPRMLLLHPILAIRHLIHETKSIPAKPKPNQSNRAKRHLIEKTTDKTAD